MDPETLVECSKLYDHYANRFEEGKFDHTAHVYVPEIKATTTGPAQAIKYYSTPTLCDLLNKEDISPSEVNLNCLEAEWFHQTDLYDLAETDWVDEENPEGASIVRCSTQFKIFDDII
jgi:hypothetical protein